MRDLFRRRVAATAALALVAGTALTQSPAEAGRRGTVVSGNARFQVLSPTLIRTEYAPTGRFTDADTFNVIGRADFTPAALHPAGRARLADHRHRHDDLALTGSVPGRFRPII